MSCIHYRLQVSTGSSFIHSHIIIQADLIVSQVNLLFCISGALLFRLSPFLKTQSHISTQLSIIFAMFYGTREAVVCSHAWPLNAHAINYENIGQTLLRRTRPSILERTLPSATWIKFKVFTAIFSLHFTEIVFCLFARSYVHFALHCKLQQFTRTGDTHTHSHTYCGKCIVCFWVESSFVWFGSLVAATPAPPGPTAVAATFYTFVAPFLVLVPPLFLFSYPANEYVKP